MNLMAGRCFKKFLCLVVCKTSFYLLFELLYHYILYAVVTQIMITMTSFPKCKQPDGPGLMLRYPHFVYLWISFYNGNSWTVYHGVSWFILNQFCCINEYLFTIWTAEWFLFQIFNSCSHCRKRLINAVA